MNPVSVSSPVRAAAVVLLAGLAGCSWWNSTMGSGDSKVDYRTQTKQTPELEVPPDLTQLAKEGRYQPKAGVVSANELAAQKATTAPEPAPTPPPAPVPAAAAPEAATAPATAPATQPAPTAARPAASAAQTHALTSAGEVRLEKNGQTRFLITPQRPEQIWPLVEAFWRDLGFTLPLDSPQTGVMETSWAENRALLPDDIVRRSIGGLMGSLYSTGLRDRYRTRVERGPDGTEIFIAHRGAEEVTYGDRKDLTIWQPRPADPHLEAEMLSRLMLRLGGKPEQAKAVVADPAKPAVAPGREVVLPEKAEMEIAEGFDRAWRQVGLALDRSGFTIEDRDRSAGLYFVRYVDPKQANREEPNFFAKLFSSNTVDPAAPQRYRVAVKAAGMKTTVSVQDGKGAPDNSENARRIVARLTAEIKP